MAVFRTEEISGEIPISKTLSLVAGDTLKVVCECLLENEPIDLTGCTVKWVLRNAAGQDKVTKVNPASLTIEDQTDSGGCKGKFDFTLVNLDTATLAAGNYTMEAAITDDGSSNRTHLLTGSVSISASAIS